VVDSSRALRSRAAATERLEDQDLLLQLALASDQAALRLAAAQALADPAILERFAGDEKRWGWLLSTQARQRMESLAKR
jgi:hypothetical protein